MQFQKTMKDPYMLQSLGEDDNSEYLVSVQLILENSMVKSP